MAAEDRKSRVWLFDFFTMVAVIIGLIYGALELRSIRAAQERDSVLELVRTIQTPEYARAMRVVQNLPDDLTLADFRDLPEEEWLLISHFRLTWESLGIMVYRRDVSLDWVDEFYRYNILLSWEKLGPLVHEHRQEVGYDGLNEWFQWLAERLMERNEGQDPVPAHEAYRDWEG